MNDWTFVLSVWVAVGAIIIAVTQSFRLYDRSEEVQVLRRQVGGLERRKDELIAEREKAENRYHLLVTGIEAVQNTLD